MFTLVDYPCGRKWLLKEIVRDEVVFGIGSVPRLGKNRLTRQFFWPLPVGPLEHEAYTPTVEFRPPGTPQAAAAERHSPERGASGENPIPCCSLFRPLGNLLQTLAFCVQKQRLMR